ncbi:MAG: hypothetical protein NZ900_05650 [Synergistetes bacterium]|nr:hypothetical protein [Synergistota bacterium]MDW8192405.1 hypothetical protein [Synergistota bacterium]
MEGIVAHAGILSVWALLLLMFVFVTRMFTKNIYKLCSKIILTSWFESAILMLALKRT